MKGMLNELFTDASFQQAAQMRGWPQELLLSHLVGDVLIGFAYCAIALALLYLVLRSKDMRFSWVYVVFAAFFLTSAISHLMLIWLIWSPCIWPPAVVKLVGAFTSIAAAISLWSVMPLLVNMPSRKKMEDVIRRLEEEVSERRHAEEALRESQATLRELAAYQERIREDERKRIAREIHDDLGQNLLALRLDVSILHARTAERHPHLHEKLVVALHHIDTTMKSVRAIINNLRPPVLDLGLHAAIEWQVKEFTRISGIACELSMDDQNLSLNDAQATTVFRVLQESLTNIRRHACATRIEIELRCDGQWLSMSVHDNGVGIFPDDRRKTHRFGLVGMAERIAMLGGELHIHGAAGYGTSLRLSIPLHAPKQNQDDAMPAY